MSRSPNPEGLARQRWYHVGRPWMDRPGMIYAGAEDPHAGTFVADTADDLGSNPDEPRFAPAVVAAIADLIVHEHNARLAASPSSGASPEHATPPAPDLRAALDVPGLRALTREEAVEKALLFTFQLSGRDYRKMQTAFSELAFIRALEQDGYTVTATPVSSAGPPLGPRESADGPHMPRPTDICAVCGNGLVHIDSSRDPSAGQGDLLDRLMELWKEPWSELAFGEAQMLLSRLRVIRATQPSSDNEEDGDGG